VSREQAKAMASNLYEEYNEFVPQAVLDDYHKMLKGGSLGEYHGEVNGTTSFDATT
jgi:hypothetical protein